jgi:hypothetical protein
MTQRIRTFRSIAIVAPSTLSGRLGISIENIPAYGSNQRIPSGSDLPELIEVFGNILLSNLAAHKPE